MCSSDIYDHYLENVQYKFFSILLIQSTAICIQENILQVTMHKMAYSLVQLRL